MPDNFLSDDRIQAFKSEMARLSESDRVQELKFEAGEHARALKSEAINQLPVAYRVRALQSDPAVRPASSVLRNAGQLAAYAVREREMVDDLFKDDPLYRVAKGNVKAVVNGAVRGGRLARYMYDEREMVDDLFKDDPLYQAGGWIGKKVVDKVVSEVEPRVRYAYQHPEVVAREFTDYVLSPASPWLKAVQERYPSYRGALHTTAMGLGFLPKLWNRNTSDLKFMRRVGKRSAMMLALNAVLNATGDSLATKAINDGQGDMYGVDEETLKQHQKSRLGERLLEYLGIPVSTAIGDALASSVLRPDDTVKAIKTLSPSHYYRNVLNYVNPAALPPKPVSVPTLKPSLANKLGRGAGKTGKFLTRAALALATRGKVR